jgi:hypothetical protein
MFRGISSVLGIAGAFVLSIAGPSNATIVGYTNCVGANVCDFTTPPPNPILANPNNGILLGWNEVQNTVLAADLRVDRVFDPGASFVETDGGGFIIKAGTIVSSHYFQWGPGNGSPAPIEATINLDSQVFAFITETQKLFDSDDALGLARRRRAA